MFYLWVHLNATPTCVIITNLSCPPIFQDIITNHVSGWLLLFGNFLKPNFIVPIKESWIYILLCYYLSCQVSECFTVSISYDHVLFSQLFSGWNILWVSNDISGLVLGRVNKKFLSNSIPFLGRLFSPIYAAV